MNKLVLIIILIGGVFWWWSSDKPAGGARSVSRLFESGVSSDYIEIKDKTGRALKCQVTAKRGAFVQVEREADAKRFVIRTDTLDGPSSRMLGAQADFNASSMDADLYALAQAAVKVELLNAPELNTFRCQYTGQQMKSSKGAELDAWRDYVRAMKLSSRDVSVALKKTADGGYYLPPGINDLPCLRIGEDIIYSRSSAAVRTAMINHYVKTVMLGDAGRR